MRQGAAAGEARVGGRVPFILLLGALQRSPFPIHHAYACVWQTRLIRLRKRPFPAALQRASGGSPPVRRAQRAAAAEEQAEEGRKWWQRRRRRCQSLKGQATERSRWPAVRASPQPRSSSCCDRAALARHQLSGRPAHSCKYFFCAALFTCTLSVSQPNPVTKSHEKGRPDLSSQVAEGRDEDVAAAGRGIQYRQYRDVPAGSAYWPHAGGRLFAADTRLPHSSSSAEQSSLREGRQGRCHELMHRSRHGAVLPDLVAASQPQQHLRKG